VQNFFKGSDEWFSEYNIVKSGIVRFEVNLFEDKKQNSTGYFSGILSSSFLINKNNKILYNAAELAADGFSNNSFIGNWTSYKTEKSKKCNFGDCLVPEFDCGDGQFIPCDEYVKNGWQSYVKCLHSEKPESDCKEEFSKWWK
jgi:hypothetical protein